MNENPGETPNPLTNSPGSSTATGNSPQPTEPVAPAEPTGAMPAEPTGAAPAEPANVEPAAPANPANEPTAPTTASVESLDPTGRPMEKTVQPAEAPKKSKTGLIAAIVAGCVLLIGGIVAAVLVMMNMNKGDAVAAAMQKIMSGEAPKNVAIDGDINILLNNDAYPIKRININLDSDIMVGSMINTSSAVLSFTDQNDKDYSMKFEEVYAANGDLFFKISDVKNVLDESGILNLMNGSTQTTNCIEDESGETNCGATIVETDCEEEVDCIEVESAVTSSVFNDAIIGVIEAIDGVYLRVSADEMNLLKNGSGSDISCVTDLVSDINKNSNSTIQLYSKYPFIASTNEKVAIASKQNPIYQIWLDDKNFAGFVNEMQNTEIASTLHSCLGWDNNATITEEDVAEITSKMPKIYAEVNNENNFTRLYMESDINDGVATATIDLGFSYPTNVNVSEPVEYTDFSEYIQTVLRSMYSL